MCPCWWISGSIVSDPRVGQDCCTTLPWWVLTVATPQGIDIWLSLGVHQNIWGTTSIFLISYRCVEWMTSVVATLSIRVNYNYTRLYEYTGDYYRTRGTAFPRSTRIAAPSFPFAVFPCQNNNWMQQENTNQKMVRWNRSLRRTTKGIVEPSPRHSRVDLLLATSLIQTFGSMRGFVCRCCLHQTRKVR